MGDTVAVEERAKEIYNTWTNQVGWVPWVNSGNSLKQEQARDMARAEARKK